MLRDRFGVSERWACKTVGQHRPVQRREPVVRGDDQALRGELRAFAQARELYPEVVDGVEEEGGVPSRLLKTDRRKAEKEGTPWQMFAGSPSGRTTTRSRSRWTSWRVRALVG
jgi:hypothetical protein